MANPEDSQVKRSELWVAVAGIIVGFLHKKLGIDLDAQSVALILGSIATYIVGRSGVKFAKELANGKKNGNAKPSA